MDWTEIHEILDEAYWNARKMQSETNSVVKDTELEIFINRVTQAQAFLEGLIADES